MIQIAEAGVGDFTVKANWILGPRKLNEYELVYFPVGSSTQYEVNDRKFVLSEPCYVITHPGEEHKYIFDPDRPTRHLFIHYELQPTAEDNELIPILLPTGSPFIFVSDSVIIPAMIKHILYIASRKKHRWKERCNVLLHGLLEEIQSLTWVDESHDNSYSIPVQIEKAISYMNKHLIETTLSVAEVSHFLGWSHEHFTRQFTKHVGYSPQEAISRYRIDRACRLLVQGQWNIKQIAYAVGFADEHYFSRSFTRTKGITASQFREKYANPRYMHLAPIEESQVSYPHNESFTFPDG